MLKKHTVRRRAQSTIMRTENHRKRDIPCTLNEKIYILLCAYFVSQSFKLRSGGCILIKFAVRLELSKNQIKNGKVAGKCGN